jgi:hypothetical protein
MKDALGNELKVGDVVALQLERPLIFGAVDAIEEGGIVTGINRKGEAEVRLGSLLIRSIHTVAVDPRVPVVNAVLALRDPSPPEELAESPYRN